MFSVKGFAIQSLITQVYPYSTKATIDITINKWALLCPNKLYLWTQKCEFHIISTLQEIRSLDFFLNH